MNLIVKCHSLRPHIFSIAFALSICSDFVNDDGSRRLLELAQELEEVFPTHDLSGQRVTTVHSHYRMLTAGCSSNFIPPTCSGSCTSCAGEVAQAKCKARKLRCQGQLILPILKALSH